MSKWDNWSRFLLEKLTVSQEIPRLLWGLKFVTMFTKPGPIPVWNQRPLATLSYYILLRHVSYNPPPKIKSSMWSHPSRLISSLKHFSPPSCVLYIAHISLSFISKTKGTLRSYASNQGGLINETCNTSERVKNAYGVWSEILKEKTTWKT